VLGLKGTMSEAELHILRARLNGGIRNKAARGELRRGLPIGLIWVRPMAKCCFTRTKLSVAQFGRYSNVSPRWAPHAGCGCGFVNRDYASLCSRARYPKCDGHAELHQDP